jgi:hypothetical protein
MSATTHDDTIEEAERAAEAAWLAIPDATAYREADGAMGYRWESSDGSRRVSWGADESRDGDPLAWVNVTLYALSADGDEPEWDDVGEDGCDAADAVDHLAALCR